MLFKFKEERTVTIHVTVTTHMTVTTHVTAVRGTLGYLPIGETSAENNGDNGQP